LALLGMVYFDIFWEATTLLLLSDLLYGTREGKNPPVIFVSFLISIIVLLLVEFVKTKLNFYNHNTT